MTDEPKKTVSAIAFMRPNGAQVHIEIDKVNPEDAKYLNDNRVKVSIEELTTGDTVAYFDDGHFIDDDPNEDPEEIIIISKDSKRTCQECMHDGVEALKERLKAGRKRDEAWLTPTN